MSQISPGVCPIRQVHLHSGDGRSFSGSSTGSVKGGGGGAGGGFVGIDAMGRPRKSGALPGVRSPPGVLPWNVDGGVRTTSPSVVPGSSLLDRDETGAPVVSRAHGSSPLSCDIHCEMPGGGEPSQRLRSPGWRELGVGAPYAAWGDGPNIPSLTGRIGEARTVERRLSDEWPSPHSQQSSPGRVLRLEDITIIKRR